MRRVPASIVLAVITAAAALGLWAATRGGHRTAADRRLSASTAVVPAALGVSVSPQPYTNTANPDSQISFLGVPAS